jgi:tRNA(Ile)-lysidine synthase
MIDLNQKFLKNITDQKLLHHNNIALAISGGPDSTALLLLAKDFAFSNNKKLVALTIDHDLRSDSQDEAIKVQKLCNILGIEHHILKWQHEVIQSGIEKKARDARYKLMTDFCIEHNISCLLVGHTLDDRVENFFIRLSRGAGIHGLSSNNIMYHNGVMIFRPLHNFEKSELIEFLTQKKIDYSSDESNFDPKFSHRNEIRYKLESFLDSNFIDKKLYKKRIVKSLDLIDQAYDIIKFEFNNSLNKYIIIDNFGFAYIKVSDIELIHPHILFLILSYLLTIIGGNMITPRAEKVEAIIDLIISKKLTHTTTHNCSVLLKNGEIIIHREVGSCKYIIDLKNINLIDNRFSLSIDGDIEKQYYIQNFTEIDYKSIQDDFDFTILIKTKLKKVKNILFTIPILKDLENNIIIPHINYMSVNVKFDSQISFFPQYVSKFTF